MSSYDLAEIWIKLNQKLAEAYNEQIMKIWISPIIPLEIHGQVLRVGVQNDFVCQYIEKQFLPTINQKLAEVTGTNFTMELVTATNPVVEEPVPPPTTGQQVPIPFPPAEKPLPQAAPPGNTAEEEPSNLNPDYIFENFVIGNSNRFAHAAALAVAEAPAHAYNPLVLYGGVGLGKTHLMHAIGNAIKQKNPHMRVLYISSEIFTNEIINSIYNKTTADFRRKYRSIDCLIIDDIQFLKGKEQTQVEFFHTFNTLKDANKQIIISSDRPPGEIETLEDRLKSRFNQGLSADIQPPDLETRMAIIRKKAESKNIELSHDVINLLATNIATNIRELEGAVTRICAHNALMAAPITVETARKILFKNNNTTLRKMITAEDIIKVISQYYHVKPEDLFGKKRTKNISDPRQLAMYLCRELADLSYPKIGEIFGGRDHTTVMHGYIKIQKSLEQDRALKKELQDLNEMLKN